jgi:hypothetical protein
MLSELSPRHNGNAFGDPDDSGSPTVIRKPPEVINQHDVQPPSKGAGFSEREIVLEVTSGRQTWKMLVHLYLRGQTLYVVRCYVPKSQFARVESDFRKALDSFTVTRK